MSKISDMINNIDKFVPALEIDPNLFCLDRGIIFAR